MFPDVWPISPCPNCGKDEQDPHGDLQTGQSWVECLGCGFVGPVCQGGSTATDAWNKEYRERNTH